MTCKGCLYYAEVIAAEEAGLGWGQCRRRPPALVVLRSEGGEAVGAQFPEVRAEDWCGEWRDKQLPHLGMEMRPSSVPSPL